MLPALGDRPFRPTISSETCYGDGCDMFRSEHLLTSRPASIPRAQKKAENFSSALFEIIVASYQIKSPLACRSRQLRKQSR
jgi:hypothetical protein